MPLIFPKAAIALQIPSASLASNVRRRSANVAASLQNLVQGPSSGILSIFTRHRIAHRPIDLEYRFCATANMSEARSEADRLNGLRRAYLQRRKASGWA